MYNPYIANGNQAVFTQNSIIRVNGIEGAKAYNVQPGASVALFDSNNDYFFIKTTDNVGFPTIRKFAFTEIKDEEETKYVTKAEFDELKEMLSNGKFTISKSSTTSKQRANGDDKDVS